MDRTPDAPLPEHQSRFTPWDVLDACQLCRRSLDIHFHHGLAGYSPDLDRAYRDMRRVVLLGLKEIPCFARVRLPAGVLPPALADLCHEPDRDRWRISGQADLVRLQGQLLTAVEAAGVPRPAKSAAPAKADGLGTERADDQPVRMAAGNRAAPERDGRPTWATARRASRKQRARMLRGGGDTIGEIARKLNVSERTVYNYLNDPQ